MIKKAQKESTPKEKNKKNKGINPYLTARRTWNNYIDSEVAQKKLWQIVALASMCCCMLCIIGIIHIGSQSKITPYIIEIDKLGRTQFAGAPPATNLRDPKIINVMLKDFIADLRTVSSDTSLQIQFVNRLYAKLANGQPAMQKVNEFFNKTEESSPFKKSLKESTATIINSILRMTEDTYAIEWQEITRDLNGEIISDNYYKAIVSIYYMDQNKASFDQLQNNPIGIYIKDFDIQKI